MNKLLIPLAVVLAFSCIALMSVSPASSGQQVLDLIAEYDQFLDAEYPDRTPGYARLASMKQADIDRRAAFATQMLEKLEAIPMESLPFSDQITWELFAYRLKDKIAHHKFKEYLNPLLVDAGFHIGFAFTPGDYRFESADDYENYIKVLQDYPRYVKEYIALMRKGQNLGIGQPKIILKGYEVTYEKHIVASPEESIFFRPFTKMPAHIAPEKRKVLLEAGQNAIMEGVVKGYQDFAVFMNGEYIPNAPEKIGAHNRPDGKAFYEQRIAYYTTLDLSADSIHNLGLQEVARIRAEMDEIIKDLKFEGSFADFLQFLRTDPQFYAKTPEEIMKEATWLAKFMDGKLPALFGKLPRQPYTVVPVPAHIAPKYTAGRYSGAPITSNRPGEYWVNTYALNTRPLYNLEALTYHEAVPGHHLQIALAAELSHLPKFRRNFYISAFGEGWGLYSEFLGKEAGGYQDPYSDFGRLTYEMWRACRLVVDTGIHAKGWTREEVMDFMAKNTALSIHEVTTETDRYISWPGQALSYKMGELKIKQLRRQAEARLGAKFDIRRFHDTLLSEGAVTLGILEKMVERYIEDVLAEG